MTSRKAKTEPMYSIREGFPRAELDEAIGVKPTARPNYYENTIITNTSFMKKGPRFMQGSFFVLICAHLYMRTCIHPYSLRAAVQCLRSCWNSGRCHFGRVNSFLPTFLKRYYGKIYMFIYFLTVLLPFYICFAIFVNFVPVLYFIL